MLKPSTMPSAVSYPSPYLLSCIGSSLRDGSPHHLTFDFTANASFPLPQVVTAIAFMPWGIWKPFIALSYHYYLFSTYWWPLRLLTPVDSSSQAIYPNASLGATDRSGSRGLLRRSRRPKLSETRSGFLVKFEHWLLYLISIKQ